MTCYNEQIFEKIDLARSDAAKEAFSVGLSTFSEASFKCQLKVVASINLSKKRKNATEMTEKAVGSNVLNTLPTTELNLKDYGDIKVGADIDETSSYTAVRDKNGNEKVVRKSSVLYLLKTTKETLSSDRLRKVQNSEIASSEIAPARTSMRSFVQTNDFIEVLKNKEICIGEWVFFKKQEFGGIKKYFTQKVTSNTGTPFLIGNIIAFKYKNGKTKKDREYSWETAFTQTPESSSSKMGVEVLANWYTFDENGDLQRYNNKFLPIKSYLGTAANPRFALDEQNGSIIKMDMLPTKIDAIINYLRKTNENSVQKSQ